MNKNYQSFEDIEYDLKRLKLERQIIQEELKGVRNDLQDDLTPANWVQTVFSAFSKFGLFMLMKKFLSKSK